MKCDQFPSMSLDSLFVQSLSKEDKRQSSFSNNRFRDTLSLQSLRELSLTNLVHGLLTTGAVIKLYNLPAPNPSIQRLSSPGPADISIAFEQILSRGSVFYDLSNLTDYLRGGPNSRGNQNQGM